MTFLTSLQNFISETEADVLAVVTDIKAGIAIIESDLVAAEHWIASNAPTIAAEIEQVVGIATTIGVASNPEVAAAIIAANTAVAALNAFAAASNSGGSPSQAVVAGYVAVKQAAAASASAMAATVSSPTTPAA